MCVYTPNREVCTLLINNNNNNNFTQFKLPALKLAGCFIMNQPILIAISHPI